VFEEGDRFFAACLPTSGQPLHGLTARLPNRRLPGDQALRILKSLCDALEAAHAKKLAHGNLTAACIFVERSQTVIADFVAPRADAKPEDDLFALGCCLYETLSGQNPFPGPDAELQKREGRFAAPSTLIPGAAAGLDGFFGRALNPDPAQRYRSPAEFFLAFRSLIVPLVS
jgi:serine/threonine protein kinase